MAGGGRWPGFPAGWRAGWRTLFAWRRMEAELDEELRDHLERKAAAYQAKGWSETAAWRRARLDLGGLETAKERCRATRRLQWTHDLAADVRHGWRLARKNPGFTLAAALTLALGLGPNAVLFSVINGLIFRPLQVPRASRLVMLTDTRKNGGYNPTFSYASLQSLRQETGDIFSGVTASTMGDLDGIVGPGGGAPQALSTSLVSGNFFRTMGVEPAVGRLIGREDGGATAAQPVAVLSYGYWRGHCSGNRSVVGKTMRVNRQPVVVIGVAPRGFRGAFPLLPVQVYLPLGMGVETGDLGRTFATKRGEVELAVMARLRPGVTLARANTKLRVIARRWAARYPSERTVVAIAARHTVLLDYMNPPSAAQLGLVAGFFLLLAGMVLAVAAINLAGLLLARAVARSPEMAMRAALGASRGRLLRQSLAESLVLAAFGGAAGLALAALGTHWIAGIHLAEIPIALDFPLDWRVVAYAAGAAIAAGLLAGAGPAWRAAQLGGGRAIAERSIVNAVPRHQRLRSALILIEIAGTLALLATAGLFVRSLWNVRRAPLGFAPQGVTNFHVGLGEGGYRGTQEKALTRRFLSRVRGLPGVQAAGLAWTTPAGDESMGAGMKIPSYRPATGGQVHVSFNAVSPGFFRTLRIPLLRGRDFGAGDGAGEPQVAIINQAMAARYWPGRDALGQLIYDHHAPQTPIRIVGIVANSHMAHPYGAFSPFLFRPLAQSPNPPGVTLEVRSALPPAALVPAVLRILRQMAPFAPVNGVQSMEASLNSLNGYDLFQVAADMAAGLGILALLLALVGVYGAMAYATSLRRREVGIRLALGAQPAQILALLLRRGLAVVAMGVTAGIVLALGIGALASGLVYGVSGHDPLTFALAAAIMAMAALAACYLPARRALRSAPLAALRQE